MDRVGVGVVAAEILLRRAVHHRAGRGAQRPFQDGGGVGAGHRAHGVEPHAEAGGEQAADRVEIDEFLHQGRVIGHRVDDGDDHAVDPSLAHGVEVEIRHVGDAILGDRLRALVNGGGDGFRGRTAIGGVELDPEISVRSAGIVARR